VSQLGVHVVRPRFGLLPPVLFQRISC